METYRVLLWLKGSSQPLTYDAVGVYMKAEYACITFYRDGAKWLHKYPTRDIFRIEEEYKYIERQTTRS